MTYDGALATLSTTTILTPSGCGLTHREPSPLPFKSTAVRRASAGIPGGGGNAAMICWIVSGPWKAGGHPPIGGLAPAGLPLGEASGGAWSDQIPEAVG
jgi:hypothetical protein